MVAGVQRALEGSPNTTIGNGEAIPFSLEISTSGADITYSVATREFTVSQNGTYLVHWWMSVNGTSSDEGVNIALVVNDVIHSFGSAPNVETQISGSALVVVITPNTTIKLVNESGEEINLEDTVRQAGITIMGVFS